MSLGQGSRLLESINEPVMRDPDHNMNQDELENLATVQRFELLETINLVQSRPGFSYMVQQVVR